MTWIFFFLKKFISLFLQHIYKNLVTTDQGNLRWPVSVRSKSCSSLAFLSERQGFLRWELGEGPTLPVMLYCGVPKVWLLWRTSDLQWLCLSLFLLSPPRLPALSPLPPCFTDGDRDSLGSAINSLSHMSFWSPSLLREGARVHAIYLWLQWVLVSSGAGP